MSSSSTLAVSIVSRPPAGIASRALTARFTRTCSTDAGSTLHAIDIRRERGDQRDVFADQAAQQLLDLPHERVEIDDLRLQHLPAAEGEQLAGERRGALARRLNLLEVRAQPIALRDLVEHQRAVAEDGGQQIVEIVRDAAGELPDRLHLLRLAQLLLEPPALGDVARVDHDRRDRRLAEAIDADAFHDPPAAVGMPEANLLRHGFPGVAEHLAHPQRRHVRIVRMHEIENLPADHLVGTPAEMTLG